MLHKIEHSMKDGVRLIHLLYLAELLVLLFLGYQILRPACNVIVPASEFEVEQSSHTTISDEGSVTVQYEEVLPKGTTVTGAIDGTQILTSPALWLQPGAYRMTVYYDSRTYGDEVRNFSNRPVSVTTSAWEPRGYINSQELPLPDSLNRAETTLQLHSLIWYNTFRLHFWDTGKSTFTLYRVELQEIRSYYPAVLLITACVFALLNALLYVFANGTKKKKLVLLGLTLICVLGNLLYISNTNFFGHDYAFHLNRILALAEELRLGNYFPAIFSTSLNGYGYATPMFYGMLFLYIPAILVNCGFALGEAYNLYLILITVATCLVMYYAAWKIFRKETSALLAAALYTLSAVRLTNIVTRGAVGEFTAQTFLPLFVLGFYQIYTAPEGERITLKAYWPIVLGFTGLLVSHTLSSVLTVYVIAAVCVVFWRKTLQKQRFFALAKAAILSVLVNLATLVPFLDGYRMELLVSNRTSHLQQFGAYFVQLLNPAPLNSAGVSSAFFIDNEMSYALGLPLVLGLLLFAVVYLLRDKAARTEANKDSGYRFAKLCAGGAVVTMLLSTVYMPYNFLTALPAAVYNFLSVYQFPWRWMVMASLFALFPTIYGVEHIGRELKRKDVSALCASVIALVLVMHTGQLYADAIQKSEIVVPNNDSYTYYRWIGTQEYLPVKIQDEFINCRNPVFDGEAMDAELVKDDVVLEVAVTNRTAQEQSLSVPLIFYNQYVAYDEEGTSFGLEMDDYGRIAVQVPGGYTGNITVEFRFPTLWKLAIGVSGVTTLAVLAFAMVKRKDQ